MKKLLLLSAIIFCLVSCNNDNEILGIQELESTSRAWGGYRNLTDTEAKWFLESFPNLNVNDVGVIDDYSDPQYNCIGWAMGVKKWIDPALSLNDFQEQFELAHVYYPTLLRFKKTTAYSASSIADGWGYSESEMKHASRLYNGDWSSKLGSSYCITHGRQAISGSIYGRILVSFQNYYSRGLVADTTTVNLSSEVIKTVSQKANEVDCQIREKFESLHEDWYKASEENVEIWINNSMYARCELPQFKALVEMGKVIIPLLMEKMLDEKYFFSQIIYEAIQTESELLPHKTFSNGTPILQSSQDRAKQMVEMWNKKSI